MFNNNKILVIVPAGNFSKQIPRKNIRLLAEKPMITHVIDMLKSSSYIDDIVISTNDNETSRICDISGVSSIRRPEEINGPDLPLEPVVFDAIVKKEKQTFDEYDIVIVVHASAPLLKVETLNKAIEKFEDFNVDSVISVVEYKNLTWGYNAENDSYFPLYKERLPISALPKTFRETGSFIATRRGFITESSMIGDHIDLMELSHEESQDINTYEDWWIAEKYLKKKRIAIVANANDDIGDGHVRRGIAIASRLVFHDIVFVLNKNYQMGINIVEYNNYPYVLYEDYDDIFRAIDSVKPDMVINDILDTRLEYILALKEKGYFIINFEDLGPGADAADLVFDSLNEYQEYQDNVYSGQDYYILKDEFYLQNPKIITQEVENVLIIIEGNDPNNLTEKILQAIINSGYSNRIEVILGVGYPDKNQFIEKYSIYTNIVVHTSIRTISELMFKADIIFTSAGRRMFEIASLGIPAICICQNQRELIHSFGSPENGFINLGLGTDVSEDKIIEEFNSLIEDVDLRRSMNEKMLAINLKDGFRNVRDVIRKHYRDFEVDDYD